MPKLINYSDRFEGIREAVYVITLRDGVERISLAAVAEWLQVSPRTVQRLLSSVEALPRLGLQWAEKRERLRVFNQRSKARNETKTDPEKALDAILETLPGSADAEDRQVWWALVSAYSATCEWARAARAGHEDLVAALSLAVVADLPEDVRTFEARRLHLVVSGAIAHICGGTCSNDEAVAMIRRHVLHVHQERLQPADDAA